MKPRTDGVDQHAERGGLQRNAAGQTDDCVFTGDIECGIRKPFVAVDRRDVDDGPAALQLHHPHFVLH
jgi:hypothetical protein